MDKDTTVLLPDYGVPDLRLALESLGFHRFLATSNAEPFEHDGLTLMVVAMTAPNDGPLGDSCLAVDDGTAAFLNQNDCRPTDLEPIVQFGTYDGHSLQYSGAIWFPMVYDLPDNVKAGLGERKRLNGLDRARRFAEAVDARWLLPNSGPPAFLDDELFEINDFGHKGNVFPDQTVFIDYLQSMGIDNALLVSTGTEVELRRDLAEPVVQHPGGQDALMRPFVDKRNYLTEYAERTRDERESLKRGWSSSSDALLPQIKEWWEPLMQLMPTLCGRLGDRILLETEHEKIIVDFVDQVVEDYSGRSTATGSGQRTAWFDRVWSVAWPTG